MPLRVMNGGERRRAFIEANTSYGDARQRDLAESGDAFTITSHDGRLDAIAMRDIITKYRLLLVNDLKPAPPGIERTASLRISRI